MKWVPVFFSLEKETSSDFFLYTARHRNAYKKTGLFFVAFGISFMLSSFLSIQRVQHFGKLPVQMGLLLMIVCFASQLTLFDKAMSSNTQYDVLFVTGFASGLVLVSIINLTLKDIHMEFAGAASGAIILRNKQLRQSVFVW